MKSVSRGEYQATLDYLYSNLPMFQRDGAAAMKKDLRVTRLLCDHLGNPEIKFKSVHVAGTNGKGSSSHFLASCLQEAGYKTGLYTSPHLNSFTERIRLNGIEINEAFVVDFVSSNRDFIEEIKPSFFEITVGMAFSYFASQEVDIAVVEVGMGGRLDSTNVLTPLVSLITNIGLDHQQWLGNTLEEIAAEKGGIIKPGIPVVIGENQPETRRVFEEIASVGNSPCFIADKNITSSISEGEWIFSYHNRPLRIPSANMPDYQLKNIKGVLQVLTLLSDYDFELSSDQVIAGINKVASNTGLRGRWQKLGSNPDVYCDVGHNADGVRLLIPQINKVREGKLFIVWGMVNDKEVNDVLSLLPKDASFVFCQASIPRAMPADVLMQKAENHGLTGRAIPNVRQALDFCMKEASPNDLIVVGGSNFVVAELDLS